MIRLMAKRPSLTRKVVLDDSVNVAPPTLVMVDLRAKRVLNAGSLFLVVQSVTITGTSFTIEVTGIVRSLTLLP